MLFRSLGHRQTVKVDLVGHSRHSGFQHTVAEHIQAQGQVLSRELCVHMELCRQGNRHASFVEVFNVQSGASCTNKSPGSANVHGVANFGSNDSDIMLIKGVNLDPFRAIPFGIDQTISSLISEALHFPSTCSVRLTASR